MTFCFPAKTAQLFGSAASRIAPVPGKLVEAQWNYISKPLLDTATTGVTAGAKGITYATFNAVTKQWEYVSKPLLQSIPPAAYNAVGKQWEYVSKPLLQSIPPAAKGTANLAGMGMVKTASGLTWAAEVGGKYTYRYIAEPAAYGAGGAISAQYRYITKPMLQGMWSVVDTITSPVYFTGEDQLQHAADILECVKGVTGSLYEMSNSTEWATKSAENILSARPGYEPVDLVPFFEKESSVATTKFINGTQTVGKTVDNLCHIVDKRTKGTEFAEDVENITRASEDLDELWKDFVSEKPIKTIDAPISNTTTMSSYVTKINAGPVELQDLQVLSPAASVLNGSSTVDLVPLEITAVSETTTALETPKSTVVVANTPIIMKKKIQPYSRNDPFHPSNTPVGQLLVQFPEPYLEERLLRRPDIHSSVATV